MPHTVAPPTRKTKPFWYRIAVWLGIIKEPPDLITRLQDAISQIANLNPGWTTHTSIPPFGGLSIRESDYVKQGQAIQAYGTLYLHPADTKNLLGSIT